MTVTTTELQAALNKIVDPTFEKTLEQLQTLSNCSVGDGRASCTIKVSSPSEEIKNAIKAHVDAVATQLGLSIIEVNWEVNVPTRDTLAEDPIPDVKNIILVMSGKGGVGKSTVAANLALALRRAGTRVGLMDADIYGPSVPTMFGIEGHPSSKDGKRMEPLQRFGVKLMSVGFLLEDSKQAVIWRGPMLHGALQQFLRDVNWGELDYLVIDLPPGTGDVALTIAQKCRITGVVMVTTPQEVALQDVYKSVSMCKKLNLPMLGVIENMSYFMDSAGVRHEIFGKGGGELVAKHAESTLIGQVPMDTEVRKWGDEGTPIVQAAPGSAAGSVFAEVADSLANSIAALHHERSRGDAAPSAEGRKRLRILR